MSKVNRRIKPEVWIGIANLILTAIIGVAVAIYLKYRDERLQKDLITLQAETSRQATLAHLQLKTTCLYYTSCAGAIEVRNLGPASAKGVIVVITINEIVGDWASAINDITAFEVKKFPASFDITYQTKRVDVLYASQEVNGNNAIEFSLPTLPPDNSIQILLTASSQVSTNEYHVQLPITMEVSRWKTQFFHEGPVRRYLENQFRIATFVANASCENCEGSPDPVHFVDTALRGFSLQTMGIKREQEKVEMQTLADASYILPQSVAHIPSSFPVYLSVSGTDEFNFEVRVIPQP